MNQFVSGESDAKGLSVILPYIAVGPAAVAIRRPELLGTLGIWLGTVRLGRAWLGTARLGSAWQGIWQGWVRPVMAWQGLSEARNLGWRNNQQTQNTHGTRNTTQH